MLQLTQKDHQNPSRHNVSRSIAKVGSRCSFYKCHSIFAGKSTLIEFFSNDTKLHLLPGAPCRQTGETTPQASKSEASTLADSTSCAVDTDVQRHNKNNKYSTCNQKLRSSDHADVHMFQSTPCWREFALQRAVITDQVRTSQDASSIHYFLP